MQKQNVDLSNLLLESVSVLLDRIRFDQDIAQGPNLQFALCARFFDFSQCRGQSGGYGMSSHTQVLISSLQSSLKSIKREVGESTMRLQNIDQGLNSLQIRFTGVCIRSKMLISLQSVCSVM